MKIARVVNQYFLQIRSRSHCKRIFLIHGSPKLIYIPKTIINVIKTMDHQLWKAIPTDILHLILKYDGRIVERNGIYMNRIPLQD